MTSLCIALSPFLVFCPSLSGRMFEDSLEGILTNIPSTRKIASSGRNLTRSRDINGTTAQNECFYCYPPTTR